MISKKETWTATALLVLLAAGAGTLLASQSETKIGYKKDIVIASGSEQEQLVAWGGTVNIEGTVRRDVLVVGSEVTISGEIGDSFVAIAARVTLKPTAVVRKDLVILGGTLVREEGSRVAGDTVYFKSEDLRERFLKRGFGGLFGAGLMPFVIIIKTISLFIWAILIVVVAGFFPKNLALAADELPRSAGPVFLTGLVAAAAYTFLMVFAAILSIILIGIPLLIALGFAAIVIKTFGRVVVYYVVGRMTAKLFNKASISPMAGAFLGLAVVSFIGFIPVFGTLLSFFLSLMAWGIALRTKFGTTENWFKRAQTQA
jgi:cytoskeletal protein CcmA (bactofilin family)